MYGYRLKELITAVMEHYRQHVRSITVVAAVKSNPSDPELLVTRIILGSGSDWKASNAKVLSAAAIVPS